jgi:A/G-specific adenine glycosylase
MLQQTQVATVLPYFARFVADFPDVATLAAAPLARVLERWSGLGYYRRAHHLHAAARIVVERHGGCFPRDAETLATLPGIGRSTAAAITAFASGERVPILDGNVKRVLARHRGVDGWPGEPRVQARLWPIAESLIGPVSGPADVAGYTQGMMDLGATVCTRTRPRCIACPVAGDCVARREARIDELPSPRPRKALPRRAVIVLLHERQGRILMERRPPLGIWGGLWSLPEAPCDADVQAVIAARFNAVAHASRALPAIVHGFTHFALTMCPVQVQVDDGPMAAGMDGVDWFTPAAAVAAAVPSPIRRLLSSVRVGESVRCEERQPNGVA